MARQSSLALTLRLFACVSLTLVLVACGSGGPEGDASDGKGGISIQNTGSDTMLQVAQAWSEAYGKVNANVSVEVAGGGSGVGIKDLMQGTVDIANCSRKIKPAEFQQAVQNTGKEPKEFIVGFDGIAVYAHPGNPLEDISLEQLAQIYKENGTMTTWSELGASAGFCPSDEIVRFSRQSNSGTYAFFRKAVLDKGDFKLGSRDMHGSKDVVDAVAHTACSIGYSGMGDKTDEVKVLAVKKTEGDKAYMPTIQNVLTKDYPIARPLFIYTLGEPEGEVKAYIDWILSPEGQKLLASEKYVPVGSTDAN